jgi:hypothetical protein
LSERIDSLKAFAELALGRLDNSLKDLRESELEWKPVEESNNIRWILTHLSQQWNMGLPRTLLGDMNYKPAGWPDDYVGNKSYTMTKILEDLKKGRANMTDGLAKLKISELDVEIPSPRGMTKRGNRLMMLISEIMHHEGQIAYIRGTIARKRQTDPHFLD